MKYFQAYIKIICIFSFQLGFGEISQLSSFDGYCRYESDDKDILKALAVTNEQHCYEQCQTTICIAFAYESNGQNMNCHLYRGGTYIKGNGRENTKCYIMPTGNSFVTIL